MKSIKEDMTEEQLTEVIKAYGVSFGSAVHVAALLQLQKQGVSIVAKVMAEMQGDEDKKSSGLAILAGIDTCIKELAVLGLAAISRENMDDIDYWMSSDSRNKTAVEAKKYAEEKGLKT